MLEELRKQLQKSSNSIEKLKEVLKRYQRERKAVVKRLDDYDKQLAEELEKTSEQAEEAARTAGTELLINNALLAIENTKEFDLPEFKQRLVEAIKDSRTITFTGTNNSITVNINLALTAGTLGDYLDGVEMTRTKLGIGQTWGKYHKESGEELASRIWREKIYGAGRENKTVTRKRKKGDIDLSAKYASQYWTTIQERLNSFSSKAPFWYIVNYGTPEIDAGGGIPYPAYSGQRFVENTIPDIKNSYFGYVNKFRDQVKKFYDDLIEKATKLIEEIDKDIDYILKLLEDLEESDIDIAINLIYRKIDELGKRIQDADPKKVLQLAYDFVEGISTEYEKTTLGVNIRIRTIKLRREFEEALAARINQ